MDASMDASDPASAGHVFVVTPLHDQPDPGKPPPQMQSPLTACVVPSHCTAVVGPEHTWPMPHG